MSRKGMDLEVVVAATQVLQKMTYEMSKLNAQFVRLVELMEQASIPILAFERSEEEDALHSIPSSRPVEFQDPANFCT
jgi:hypothetical protein